MTTSQTTKAMYVQLSIQHRKALELLRGKTGLSIKALIVKGIEEMAVKHGLVTNGEDIRTWPNWD